MGLSNKLFEKPFNCTDVQLSCQNAVSGNSESYDGYEVSNDQLDLVVFYSSQLGVPVRRNAKDINVVKGKEIFLLMSGDVGIFLPTNDTKDPNFKVGENEVFGEMGVIEHKPRMASARCMSDATVIALSESEFEARVEKADPFIRALLRILSQTVRNLQDKK